MDILDKRYWGVLLFTAAIFFASGKVGFFLSADSGFAALIWPPAGISLGLVLYFGHRVWPGIFIGAYLVSVSQTVDLSNNFYEIFNSPLFLFIAAGATLQPMLALWTVNKFSAFSHDFSDPKKIGLFYLIIGPVCCLTSASVASVTFLIAGISSINGWYSEWFFWWIADSTSSIIFGTLIFAFMKFDKIRQLIVSSVIGVAIILGLGIFIVGQKWEDEKLDLLFRQEVSASVVALNDLKEEYTFLTNNLIGFKLFRPNLTKEDFKTFAEHSLSQYTNVRSIAWEVFVPSEQRQAIENNLSEIHGKTIEFWEFDENHEPMTALNREDYIAVKFVEPYETYDVAIGHIVDADESRVYALRLAAEERKPTISAPVVLITQPGSPSSAVIYQAYYEGDILEGYFAFIIRIDKMVNQVLSRPYGKGFSINLRDMEAGPDLVFSSVEDNAQEDNSLGSLSVEFPIFNRTWSIEFKRTQWFIEQNQTKQPLYIGLVGLIFASLIAIGVTILSGQRLFLEKLVQKRTSELTAANKTKTEFLSNMSHELRTPLNAIIGFSEIMKSGIIEKDNNSKYQEYSSDIFDSGSHLLQIINDILDLSKIEANKVNLEDEEVSLVELVRPTIGMLKNKIDEKDIQIVMHNSSMEQTYLEVDVRLFKQIFLNLLSNAVKFTNPLGSIEIKSTFGSNGEASISIIDNGIGMDPNDIPMALEPFKQINTGLNRLYEGTGLGLPLVRSFVELHGGKFELISQLEIGTTAIIHLPESRLIRV